MTDSASTQHGYSSKRRPSAEAAPASAVKRARQEEAPEIKLLPAAVKQLSYEDYTIGWICALPLEMTAARAMLDEVHLSLPKPRNDDNSYVLGSIKGHNVVMVCLPSGVYGKAAAAVAATRMHYTFINIDVSLLVGVGGGAPRPNEGVDIRLGDVVVSTPTSEHPAVVQYDHGKTGSIGFESKGTLNKPKASLLSAVSNLRSQHGLSTDRIELYMNEAIKKHSLGSEFSYPGSKYDILWEPACGHDPDTLSCSCEEYRQASRLPRQHIKPKIHYGPVASGDQVIKDHRIRNSIARKHGILCFEMEAAGLMDTLQALVIRGICDYCDSRKSKEFQPYAALAAAAFARELLSIMPLSDVDRQIQRKKVKEALAFSEADNRRTTIKTAHPQTCSWLLKESSYRDWQNPTIDDHKLLWVKGKAGIGKSTIMKFVLDHIQSKDQPGVVIISFFFNAQGAELEKSTLGLYRSLLSQLFSKMSYLDDVLDRFSNNSTFTLGQLEEIFQDVVAKLGSTQLVCLVDALDECPEDQVREMLRFFERIVALSTIKGTQFCILFSSRHYPNISTTIGKIIILEQKDGQWNDLRRYINAELRIGKNKQAEEIKTQLLQKSSRIFLWVVLVVLMLNREFDKGRIHTLKKRLADVPQELDKLFQDILARDNERLPELILCIQWMLYAKRPLSPKELYFALLANDEDNDLEWDETITTRHIMDNMILDCSKGLAETTWSQSPSVQFIHESVREFLQKPKALQGLYHSFEGMSEEDGHQRLRDGCLQQLQCLARRLEDSRSPLSTFYVDWRRGSEASRTYPFLDYAVRHMLSHANHIQSKPDSNIKFLQSFDSKIWHYLFHRNPETESYYQKWIEDEKGRHSQFCARLPPHIDDDLGITLARQGWYNLLATWWKLYPPKESVLIDLMYIFAKQNSPQDFHEMLSAYLNHESSSISAFSHHLTPLTDCLEIWPYQDLFFEDVGRTIIRIARYCWKKGNTVNKTKIQDLTIRTLNSRDWHWREIHRYKHVSLLQAPVVMASSIYADGRLTASHNDQLPDPDLDSDG